jgi:hypothetical protein
LELGVLDTSRALQKASGVLTNCSLDLLALQTSDVTMEALNQQTIMPFSNEKAMKVTNFVQDSLYMKASYHQV